MSGLCWEESATQTVGRSGKSPSLFFNPDAPSASQAGLSMAPSHLNLVSLGLLKLFAVYPPPTAHLGTLRTSQHLLPAEWGAAPLDPAAVTSLIIFCSCGVGRTMQPNLTYVCPSFTHAATPLLPPSERFLLCGLPSPPLPEPAREPCGFQAKCGY